MRPALALVLATALLAACQAAPAPPSAAPSASGASATASLTVRAPATPTASAEPRITTVEVATVRKAAVAAQPSAVRFADAAHGWVGTGDGLLGTTDGGATWTRQLTSERIARIRAFDEQHAWAFAADGTVYRTEDGLTWTSIPATTPRLRDVFFASPVVGWAVAAPDPAAGKAPAAVTSTLLHTTDGGVIWRTWTSQPIQSVCFVGEQRGWGANGDQAFRSDDGGRTWALAFDAGLDERGLPPFSAQIACADTASAWVQLVGTGAAMSHAPYLVYELGDGGASARLAYGEGYTLGSSVPGITAGLGSYPSIMGALPAGGASFITCTPPASRQRVVIDAPTGRSSFDVAGSCALDGQVLDGTSATVITYSNLGAWLLRTSDAGQHWEALYPAPGAPLSRFAMAGGALVGVARVGDPRGVFTSADGGRSWSRIGEIPSASDELPYLDLGGPSFVDRDHGWVVGMDHGLYSTTDGGEHWMRLSRLGVGTDEPWRVLFTDLTRGWLSTASALLVTSDGGATWRRVHEIASHSDLECVPAGCWAFEADRGRADTSSVGRLVFIGVDGSATPIPLPEIGEREPATLRLHFAGRLDVAATSWPFEACHDFGLRSCARLISHGMTAWSEVRIPIETEWPADLWWTSATTLWLRTDGHLYRSGDTGHTWTEVDAS